MTTTLRGSIPSLFIGVSLGLMVCTGWASTAWAAPPDETDASVEAESAPEAEPAPAAEGEPAEVEPPAPEVEPAADEPAEPEAATPDENVEPASGPIPPETPSPLEPSTVNGRRVPPLIGDKHSVQYSSLIAPRINPLGLEARLWIGYQYRLYNKDKTILNGSNLAVFFRPILNPAVALVGATVQVQPAAVLRLRATYSYIQWFGTFQFFQSYESPYDDYSEQRIDEQSEVNQNYVTGGHQVELEALVQAKVKGLIIRSSTFGIYNFYPNLRGDDDVFYDPRYDLFVPAKGWMLHNDSDLLWQHEFKSPKRNSLLAGARATTLMPFFPKDVYEEGDTVKNPVGPQLRIGPALGYIFYDRPEKRFNKPTLLLLPQWNVLHRWRTGRDTITAYPTIIIAFAFNGQLWGKS